MEIKTVELMRALRQVLGLGAYESGRLAHRLLADMRHQQAQEQQEMEVSADAA